MNPLRFVFFLAALASLVRAFPRNSVEDVPRRAHHDLESSGTGADEPIRGSVRVVKVGPHFLRKASGLFGRRVQLKDAPSRSSFPAFLALGRAGPSSSSSSSSSSSFSSTRNPVAQRPRVHDAKKRQGMEMWQRVMDKKEKEMLSLPINPKDLEAQSCAAVPFTQRITEEGCEMVTVHNKLCFGQCSSMFVPPSGETLVHRTAPCTRCAPSRARTVRVPLRCGTQVREKRVMMVEECKCETGRENTSEHL